MTLAMADSNRMSIYVQALYQQQRDLSDQGDLWYQERNFNIFLDISVQTRFPHSVCLKLEL